MSNTKKRTGQQWCMTQRADEKGHGDEILGLMREYDLFASDTLFKPEKKMLRTCRKTKSAGHGNRTTCAYQTDINQWSQAQKYVAWGSSIYSFCQKYDHGLVSATWHWKTKKNEKKRRPDFLSSMDDQSWLSFARPTNQITGRRGATWHTSGRYNQKSNRQDVVSRVQQANGMCVWNNQSDCVRKRMDKKERSVEWCRRIHSYLKKGQIKEFKKRA